MAKQAHLEDGTVLEFPDNTPDSVVDAAVRSYLNPGPDFGNVQSKVSQYSQAPSGPIAMSPNMQPDPPTLEEINARNAAYRISPQAAMDKQAFEVRQAEIKKQDFQALPMPARVAIGAGSRVGSAGRGIGQLYQELQGDPSQMIAAEEAARQNDQFMEGDIAADAGKVAGEFALTAVPMSKVGGVTKLGRVTRAGAAGSAYGLLQPVVDDESRTQNVVTNGLLGAGGQGIGEGLLAWGSKAANAVTPELRKIYEFAKSKGITLTPAQLTDSAFLKRMAGMSDNLPFSGATKRREAQQQAGRRALAELVGEDSPTFDPTTIGKAADHLGDKFEQIFAKGTRYDEQFARDLAAIKSEADATLDGAARRTINHLVNRLKEQANDWHLPGPALQSLDKQAQKYATGGGDREQVASAFREALHDNFGRNAGEAAKAAWHKARKQWADLKTLEPLVSRHPEGDVPMQQVLNAVNATPKGRLLVARDKAGDIGELAKVGQRMKAPNSSGTAENLQAGGLGAGMFANPLATLGLLGTGTIGGRLLNSGLLSNYMMSAERGATRKAAAPYIASGLLAGHSTREKPTKRKP